MSYRTVWFKRDLRWNDHAALAHAAELIHLKVGGYMEQSVGYVDQDVPGKEVSGFDNKSDTEIWFTGSTVLDNGIEFGVNVQLEGNSTADQIDESYLTVGSGFGKLIAGSENSAMYLLHVAPKDYGIGLKRDGYIMFVAGPPASGRHALARDILVAHAQGEPVPGDWGYVNNFDDPQRPRALPLPPGRASRFKADMERLVEELHAAIPAVFEGEEFRNRRQAIEDEAREHQEQEFQRLGGEAQEKGLALVRTQMGLTVAPVRDGEVIAPEEFRKLPEEDRKRIEADIEAMQGKLQELVRRLPEVERDRRRRLRELMQEMTRLAVTGLIGSLRGSYDDVERVADHIRAVEQDVIHNVEAFLPREGQPQQAPDGQQPGGQQPGNVAGTRDAVSRRYQVNVMVSHDPANGAPVENEALPTQPNLVGRVEHLAMNGALITDFLLIKPGALHRANGGYLVLDALKLLQQPFAYEALKRSLRSRQIPLESPAQMMSLLSTVTLEPEPIPLDIKVILVGDWQTYHLLLRHDPDFADLFKVQVDLAPDVKRADGTALDYARLVATLVARHELRPVDRAGVARVIDQAARLAGHAGKATLQVGRIADLLRGADHFAGLDGADVIGERHVERAIAAQVRRADGIRERAQEHILEETVLIDTDGARVGQINGLAVLDLGNFAFGRPSRITARVRLGAGEVVDVERRVELGGPLHSKGILILGSFIAARFGQDRPLSLSASLVFEQSYGGVDGDSASSAEVYALLSAIGEVPLRQDLAVTGSVNQFGEVQAIGGANEKIEGFFDICSGRGLTGRQGVLIPASNVKHLMLRRDVVEACRAGRFAVYPVRHVDDGIELLTGLPAGEKGADGSYPEGSVNARVQARLDAFAERRRAFGATGRGEADTDPAGRGRDGSS